MSVKGSSPLTRGKPLRGLQRPGPQGLIPAHAGKTPCPSSLTRWQAAHPRSRGENERTRTMMNNFEGSSPLTRGKPDRNWRTCRLVGLIPAHAGKTPPHADNLGNDTGSSPLTRGKHTFFVVGQFNIGLIPAHAGKTPFRLRSRAAAAAHPRSRGENVAALITVIVSLGSSPLTRGKRCAGWRLASRGGLIPAHAGKT